MNSIILSPRKIGRFLFMEQAKWTTWFLSFMFVIYIVVISFATGPHSSFIDLANFSNGSSSIYMLVLGILTTSSFFYYYMLQGATRKNFFFGTLISTVLLAVTITIIFMLLAFIIQFVSGWVGWNIHAPEVDFTSSFSAFIDTFGSFVIVHLIYYLIGWMIGLTFYRSGWLYGLFSIVLSLFILAITGILMEMTLFSFFSQVFYLPTFVTIPLSLVLVVALYGTNYRLMKDITIKV
ncbi:hypothetical protein [Oceanobacillus timonensis]|uniref:hypothetical protein n=1 Tax=Oceanobacillus timonensis TaxID=1926285 RepID=UPI0009B9A09B|nr:hypothetical protein [Oceanobacillus timonensis]